MTTEEAMRTGGALSRQYGRDTFQQRGNAYRKGESDGADERLANALGWLSLGMGLVGLAAPGTLAQLIGVPDNDGNRRLIRGIGLREIASGAGILAQPRPAGWVKSRVAGDVMDLALLGSALNSPSANRDRVLAATAAVVGITGVDLYCSERLTRSASTSLQNGRAGIVQRTKVTTISRSPEEVYRFWRRLENLPRFIEHLASVQEQEGGRSHWRACGPGGVVVEWDAEIVDDRPNEMIAWRSLPGADVSNGGTVWFQPAPGGRGTEVRVQLEYEPPTGMLGANLARLIGQEPGQMIADSLRSLKQVLETGEVVQSDGSLAGKQFPQHPAQPAAPQEPRRPEIRRAA